MTTMMTIDIDIKHLSNFSNSYIIQLQPGECNSIINTGGVFTLQKHLVCDCSEDPALTVDGRGTVLKLNGYTVECKPGAGLRDIIKVVGAANTVMGPGTGKS